jgi:hypothetical protein
MKKLSTLALGVFAALTMNAALAQTAPAKLTPRVPTEAENVVMRADVLARAAKRFDAIDTNKDGVLSADERRAAHAERRAAHAERRGPPPGGPAADRLGPPPGGPAADRRGPPPPHAGGPDGPPMHVKVN